MYLRLANSKARMHNFQMNRTDKGQISGPYDFSGIIWNWCSSPGSIPAYRHEVERELRSACRNDRKWQETSGVSLY
jgi:formylglycine-generating enzyme required for sulfatase activity